jgi:hypothetical protein
MPSLFSKKVQLVVALVGTSFVSGWFLNLALMVFDKEYASLELQLLSFGARLVLAAATGFLAVQNSRELLRLTG